MIKKIILIVLVSIGVSNFSFAQQQPLDSLKNVLVKTKNDSIKCDALYSLIGNSFLVEKENYSKQLLEIATKNSSKSSTVAAKNFYISMEIEALSNLGLLAMDRGDFSKKIEKFLTIAVDKAKIVNDPTLKAMCGNNLGLFYYDRGNINLALHFYKAALKTLQKNKINEGRSYLINNIASIYHENNDFDLALKYYKQSITKYALENENSNIISVYNNIGSIYSELKKLKPAFFYLNKAIDLAIKTNDKQQEVTARNGIGVVYISNNEKQKAIENYQNALAIAKEINFKIGIVVSNCRLSEIYRLSNNFEKAIIYGERAMEKAKEIKSPDMMSRASEQLMLAYEKTQNYKKAYLMKDIYTNNLDSIKNKKTEKEIIHSQYQQEYSTKAISDSLKTVGEKKIQVLQLEKQNTQKQYLGLLLVLLSVFAFFVFKRYKQSNLQKKEIEIQKNIIQESLSEKEILLKEIHHRVKNNLQVISSLLGLQSAKIDDENLKAIFAESKNKINTISLIHQKLYQNDNLSEIDMKDYFESLYSAIASIFNNSKTEIDFALQTNNLKFDIDTSVPLGLIFNELMTNIFKYAFQEEATGKIEVVLSDLKNGVYELKISDNGNGFDEVEKDKNSLGLNLVKMLTTQLNGKFERENKNGVVNTITFEDTNQRKKME